MLTYPRGRHPGLHANNFLSHFLGNCTLVYFANLENAFDTRTLP